MPRHNDKSYHREYYLLNKEAFLNRNRTKFVKKKFGLDITADELEVIGADYKFYARFCCDVKKMQENYPELLLKLVTPNEEEVDTSDEN